MAPDQMKKAPQVQGAFSVLLPGVTASLAPRDERVKFSREGGIGAGVDPSLSQSGRYLGSTEQNCHGAVWLDELEEARAPLVEARCAKLEAAGSSWHRRRAAGLRRPLRDRLETCQLGQLGHGRAVVVACECGPRAIPIRCGQRLLCRTCKGAVFSRLRDRLLESLKAHMHAAERAGRRRRPVFVTGTVRHSGELDADRRALQGAWEKLRKWCWKRIGGAFTYALVWECTCGQDGLGHVHWHAVVLWPYLDWSDVLAEWRTALDDESAFIKLDPIRTDAEGCAHYLAKYVSKGVEADSFQPNLAAQVLDAAYGKRIVTTSRGFWTQTRCACKKCGAHFAYLKLTSTKAWANECAWEAGWIRANELAPVPAD